MAAPPKDKKPPKPPENKYAAMVKNAFPHIPASADAVRSFIRKTNDRLEKAGKDLLSEARLLDTAANHFRAVARQADPELGIRENPHRNETLYNHADKGHVLKRIRQSYAALEMVEGDKLRESGPLGFVGMGMAASLLGEGAALPGKGASHTDIDGPYSGLMQVGASATLATWKEAQNLANTMVRHFPDGHPYKNVRLEGADFWKNANAVHVQMAIAYTQMKPLLERLGKIPGMSDYEKALLMPIGNSIPLVLRKTLDQLEAGKKLKDIALADMPAGTKPMMANNPRQYVDDAYMAAEKAEIADRKKKKLPQLGEKQIMESRIAHLKPHMEDVMVAMDKNVQNDADQFLAMIEKKAAPASEAAKARKIFGQAAAFAPPAKPKPRQSSRKP